MEKEYFTALSESFKVYLQTGYFFLDWYRKKGKAYHFVFKKNLKVTNIQLAELVSLIKRFSTQKDQLNFLSVKQLNISIAEIVSSFKDTLTKIELRDNLKNLNRLSPLQAQQLEELNKELKGKSKKTEIANICEHVANKYGDQLKNVVILDIFWGSCAVFLPMGLEIQIQEICAYSGYINSCGEAIYIRNVEKAHKEELFKDIELYIQKNNRTEKLYFSIYTHEDFTEPEKKVRDIKDIFKNGLDDLKIYIEKFYMGEDPLVIVLEDLRKKFKDKIEIIDTSDKVNDSIRRNRTIWLFIDHALDLEKKLQSPERYYVCYEQQWKNENQIHLFDENKPAWKSSTTIPDTLINAMINVAIPYCKKNKIITLYDPFVGTGTTYLETLKFTNIKPTISDIDKFSPILLKDNLNFFSLDKTELEKISHQFDEEKVSDNFKWLFDITSRYNIGVTASRLGEFDFEEKAITEISKLDFIERLRIYIYLKARINHDKAILRGREPSSGAVQSEARRFKAQIDKLIEYKKDSEKNVDRIDNVFIIADSSFSKKIILCEDLFKTSEQGDMVKFIDQKRLFDDLEKTNEEDIEKFDLIITDPPYGFNTTQENQNLSDLYIKMVKNFLRLLNDAGQIVMALPDKSFSGKFSPFFTHKEMVVQQFITEAQNLKKEIVTAAEVLPSRELFCPPYYWESERALRRSIVHLRIRNLN